MWFVSSALHLLNSFISFMATGIKYLGSSIGGISQLVLPTKLECEESMIDSSYETLIPTKCIRDIKGITASKKGLDALLDPILWPVVEFKYEETLRPGVRVMDFVIAYVKNRAEKCPEKKPLTENHFNCFREKLFNGGFDME